ncbi:MAG: hypothetical protein LBL52_01260 [Rickettsiales bacterium]|jgi:16S rRNA processing protein RimM|nr:hypothetical protein [Rickettsiales bacterium]
MMILVAKIVGAHGIKGGVKIRSFVEDLSALPLFFKDGKPAKLLSYNGRTAQLEGIADRNAAEAMQGTELFTDRKNLATDDEILLDELEGFEVSNGGRVAGWLDFGAGAMLEIDRGQPKTALVLMAHVLEIDRKNRTLKIDEDFLVQS